MKSADFVPSVCVSFRLGSLIGSLIGTYLVSCSGITTSTSALTTLMAGTDTCSLTKGDELSPIQGQDIKLVFAPSHISICLTYFPTCHTHPRPVSQSSSSKKMCIAGASMIQQSDPVLHHQIVLQFLL